MIKKCRLREFFEADNQQLSMTRLLCFLSFFPASYVVIETSNEGTLGWYLGAYVLSYVGGKTADVFNKPTRVKNINLKTDEGDINVERKMGSRNK